MSEVFLCLTLSLGIVVLGTVGFLYLRRIQMSPSDSSLVLREKTSEIGNSIYQEDPDLVFVDPDTNESFLIVSRGSDCVDSAKSYKSADLVGLERNLGPAIQSLPGLLKTLGESGRPFLKVTFTDAAMKALGNGEAVLTSTKAGGRLLPVLREAKTGRFREIGTAKEAALKGGLKLATLASAAWQVATIVTAQHHLAEISARLEKIEGAVQRVESFLRDEERAKILASIKVLRDYANSLRAGSLTSEETVAVIIRLEDIEALSLGILSRATVSLFRLQDELPSIRVDALLDRKASMQRIHDAIDCMKKELDVINMAAQCRVVASSVKSLLPGDQSLVRSRLEDTLQLIQSVCGRNSRVREVLEERSRELRKRSGPIFIFDEELREGIRANLADFERQVEQLSERIGQHSARSTELLSKIREAQSRSHEFLAKIDKRGDLKLLVES